MGDKIIEKTLASIGIDVNIPTYSALNLALGLTVPIVVWFLAKKYIK